MPKWLNDLGFLLTVAVAVATLWRWALGPLRRQIEEVGRDVKVLDTRIVSVEEEVGEMAGALTDVGEQMEGVTRAMVPMLADRYAQRSPEQVAELLATFNGTWRRLTGWEQSRQNPLTENELVRFEQYRVKFFEHHQYLTPAEWSDFQAMLEKLDQEKPKPPGLPALFILSGILGVLAGVAIGGLAKPNPDPEPHSSPQR